MTRVLLAGAAAVVAGAICLPALEAPAARGDGDSFIRYINDNNIFLPALNDAIKIRIGGEMCALLHNGLNPEQVAQSSYIFEGRVAVYDVPRTIEAAQHELCPDTLH